MSTEIKVGSIWKEVDPRLDRQIEVVGFCDETGKVIIKSNGRVTKARRERFNGKRGGYEMLPR